MPFIQKTVNTKNFVQVGEMVSLPRHKMVGKVVDKLYRQNDVQPLRIVVEIDYLMSSRIYKGIVATDKLIVEPEELKSLKANIMYSKIVPIVEIPNLLERKDIKKGSIVRIVDNYMMEKMLTYEEGEILFTNFNISKFVNQKAELTGSFTSIGTGWNRSAITVVQCKFENGHSYYMYIDSIQLVKKVNIFMKMKKIFKKVYVVIIDILERINI